MACGAYVEGRGCSGCFGFVRPNASRAVRVREPDCALWRLSQRPKGQRHDCVRRVVRCWCRFPHAVAWDIGSEEWGEVRSGIDDGFSSPFFLLTRGQLRPLSILPPPDWGMPRSAPQPAGGSAMSSRCFGSRAPANLEETSKPQSQGRSRVTCGNSHGISSGSNAAFVALRPAFPDFPPLLHLQLHCNSRVTSYGSVDHIRKAGVEISCAVANRTPLTSN